MGFRRFFDDEIDLIVLMHGAIDLNRHIVASFHPVHSMMIDFDGGDAFDQIRGMAQDMDLIAQFQLVREGQHCYLQMGVVVGYLSDFFFQGGAPSTALEDEGCRLMRNQNIA